MVHNVRRYAAEELLELAVALARRRGHAPENLAVDFRPAQVGWHAFYTTTLFCSRQHTLMTAITLFCSQNTHVDDSQYGIHVTNLTPPGSGGVTTLVGRIVKDTR
jgi:hypothetical protein